MATYRFSRTANESDGIVSINYAWDDIDTLAVRIEELLGNPEKCRRMGATAQSLVSSRYSWEHTQQKMWGAIRQMI